MQYVILMQLYEENLALFPTYAVGKWKSIILWGWRNILIAFSGHWRYSFVLLHQNLIIRSFLKVSCSVEAETILINILHTDMLKMLKILWSLLNFEQIFCACMILTLCAPWKGLRISKESSDYTLRTTHIKYQISLGFILLHRAATSLQTCVFPWNRKR